MLFPFTETKKNYRNPYKENGKYYFEYKGMKFGPYDHPNTAFRALNYHLDMEK